jgi:hypothetical protein
MSALQALGVLIVRLWAASVMITNLSYGVQFVFLRDTDELNRDYYLQSGVWLAAWLAIGIVAWFAAPPAMRRIVSSREEALSFQVNAFELVALGSFLIGAYYIVAAVPQLATDIFSIFIRVVREPDVKHEIADHQWRQMAAEALTMVVAAILALRPRDFATLFTQLRYAGLAKIDEAPNRMSEAGKGSAG